MVQPVFYKWRNTPRHWTYKWIQIYITCWFEIWQPSDLTRGLGECPILSYRAIQGVESFSARYACSIDELQSTMFVKGMSIEKLPKYQRCSFFSQRAPSQRDSSLVTSQFAAPKFTPAWNQGMGDWRKLFCSQTLIIVSSSRCLSEIDHMYLHFSR